MEIKSFKCIQVKKWKTKRNVHAFAGFGLTFLRKLDKTEPYGTEPNAVDFLQTSL